MNYVKVGDRVLFFQGDTICEGRTYYTTRTLVWIETGEDEAGNPITFCIPRENVLSLDRTIPQ